MELNKCLGCMEDFQGYPCPKCGFAPEQTQKNTFALPPQTILVGKFLLGRVLGQDEIGITYIGWDIGLGQKVAIREYFPGLGICTMREVDTGHLVWRGGESAERARGEIRELFLEEAKKTAKADGIPGIARIRGMFRANDTDYIVMDYVEGENLRDRIRKSGPLSWEQAKRVFRPALQTMEAVHKAGLLHRNLNPGNLVLTPDGQVKILGLGLLDYRNINHTFSAPLMSSLGEFGAPERAQKSAGPWTDVYSMAATVYYALTGNTICLDLDETVHAPERSPCPAEIRPGGPGKGFGSCLSIPDSEYGGTGKRTVPGRSEAQPQAGTQEALENGLGCRRGSSRGAGWSALGTGYKACL